ncbi:MAG: polysaccharide pyruvyl transferase family protein [Acidobacteria bacterium]|nr:polysaccharide pyruvyl transferase family protein [Acidobacteriota bacterium]
MKRRAFLAAAPASVLAQSAARKKILLRTGWQMRNIGDVCFTPAMLGALARFIPEADVTCWAANIDESGRKLIRRDFPQAKFLDGRINEPGKPTPPHLRTAFEEMDLFLYNSGMVINYGLHGTHDWERTLASVTPLFLAGNLGKPYGTWAQTFDTFDPPSPIVLQRVLSGAKFLFTRDSISIGILKEAGIQGPHIAFAPDIAFQYRQRNDAAANGYLTAAGLERGRFLVAIIHYAVLDRPGVKERGAEYVQKMREVLVRWVRETKLPILIAPEDDREIALGKEQLIDPMPADVKPYLKLREKFWLPDEALSVFLASRTMFNMEPHGNIMALANGLPCLHCFEWAFGKKAEMFNDIGLGEWAFHLASATPAQMGDALLGVHHDYAGAQRKRERAMQVVEQKTREGFVVIRRTMGLM